MHICQCTFFLFIFPEGQVRKLKLISVLFQKIYGREREFLTRILMLKYKKTYDLFIVVIASKFCVYQWHERKKCFEFKDIYDKAQTAVHGC